MTRGTKEKSMIELNGVSRVYQEGKNAVTALQPTTLKIDKGEFVCVAGPSGSGKTTLLNLMAGIDTPSTGSVVINNQQINGLSPTHSALMRRQTIGFVFQTFNLIPVLSAFENVEYVLLLRRVPSPKRAALVEKALKSVGLGGYEGKRPFELSGGQQQRVAVARAIVGEPSLVLADEPTGNLDSQTGSDLMALLQKINHQQQTTFVFSSHDPRVIESARRIIYLRDGLISDQSHNQK
ncbi:MAG: ABC transporter ATP-binding protein [Desulfobulbaceae bacterium]|nr:ABC transporter ATP-binding protein [Desulfobulbaceae bacterium]